MGKLDLTVNVVRGTDLWKWPVLACSMFADRKAQFGDRLKWEVAIENERYERDQYDAANPIYIIVGDDAGNHLGSMRLMPVSGPTMIFDYFASAATGIKKDDPGIWECTRFCLSPNAPRRVASIILATAARCMPDLGATEFVGVFDQRMVRIYQIAGARPEIIGRIQTKEGLVMAGRWCFSDDVFDVLMRRPGVDCVAIELALANFSPWPSQQASNLVIAMEDWGAMANRKGAFGSVIRG